MQKSGLCLPARQKRVKNRSLHFVAEHFEPVFNADGGCGTDFCIWLGRLLISKQLLMAWGGFPSLLVGAVLFLAVPDTAYPDTPTQAAVPETPDRDLRQSGESFPGRTPPERDPAERRLPGRLFFTEPERREFDRLRAQRQEQQAAQAAETGQTRPPTESLAIDGIVVRGDGRNTIWINGEPFPEGDTARGRIRVVRRSDNTVGVEISRGRNHVWLKPGQKIILQGEKIIEIH
uniref:Uncharacterized protein n=1 Tax=Candidatus Kentrum sp. DK TaxID=2126562 RepID=A0A450SWI6_9GAMM|nr:MAG: hypothetical protein BECKDK2373C_GA0170839_10656 [Candidatus Kentron sp. DK]